MYVHTYIHTITYVDVDSFAVCVNVGEAAIRPNDQAAELLVVPIPNYGLE